MKLFFIVIYAVVLSSLLYRHLDNISKSRGYIDNLAESLLEVKKLVYPSSTIAFSTDESPHEAILFQTQFVMSPVIVKHDVEPGDTVLFIAKNPDKLPQINYSQRVYHTNKNGFYISLIIAE